MQPTTMHTIIVKEVRLKLLMTANTIFAVRVLEVGEVAAAHRVDVVDAVVVAVAVVVYTYRRFPCLLQLLVA